MVLGKNPFYTPVVNGTVPLWIDVGDNKNLILQAVKTIRNNHFQQSEKHQQYLLHDGCLSTSILKQCWEEQGTCFSWDHFVGCEANAVLVLTSSADDSVTASHLESISRAKINLAIVTYCQKQEIDPNLSIQFKEKLR